MRDLSEPLNYARRHREKFVHDLQELAGQPGISAQGRGIEATVALLEDRLEALGAAVDVFRSDTYGPLLYARLENGAERTLVLYNHYDVQPAEPLDEWVSDPFEPVVRDGALYARGVADNKGDLVARLAAVEAFQESGRSLDLNIDFVIEGEEEVGSPGLPHYVERLKKRISGDVCLWEGAWKDESERLEIQLGCKGILYVELVCRGPKIDLHSSWASLIENPVWRLHQVLSTLYDPVEGRVVIPGFYDDVRPTRPEEERLVAEAGFPAQRIRDRFGVRGFVGGVGNEEALGLHLSRPTCNICGIEAGYTGEGAKTVLPSEARVKLDFRLVPDQAAERVLHLLRKHLDRSGLGDGVELVTHGAQDPAQTDPDHPFVSAARTSAEAVYDQTPVVLPRTAGTGPMAVFNRDLGLPTVNGAGVGYSGSQIHAPNEHIRLEDFYQGIEHLVHLFDRC